MSTAKKAPAKKAPAKKAALKPAPTYKRLKGQRVFITGAGSGIGRATALRFAAEGAQLALADLRGAKETAAEIKKAGGTATATLLASDILLTAMKKVPSGLIASCRSISMERSTSLAMRSPIFLTRMPRLVATVSS